MTTATRRSRTRKAQTIGRELMRRPADALSGDFIILSARLAETPPPVFWAKGELDARTKLAVHADADWDGHYRAVFGDDPWWDWNWYRDARLRDELEAVPVVTLTVTRDLAPGTSLSPLGELSTANEARFRAVFGDEGDGSSWRLLPAPVDDPGPVPAQSPPGPASSPRGAPSQGAGPGSPDDDPAPAEARDD